MINRHKDYSLSVNWEICGEQATGEHQIFVQSGGDGLAFVVHNTNNSASNPQSFLPHIIGKSGRDLGYGGMSNAFAVEFDTIQNTDSDPQLQHVW